SQYLVDQLLRVIDEEVEMESGLGCLRFRHSLKGHDRRSIRAVVASLDRHVRASGRARATHVSQDVLPELRQPRRIIAVHCDAYLAWVHLFLRGSVQVNVHVVSSVTRRISCCPRTPGG